MATALSADNRFGAAHTDIVVTQPLVLQAALPRFARPGDRFEAGVLVTNRTDAAGEATVTAEADGLALHGDASKRVRLDAGETREVRFDWTAERTGDAALTFAARLGNERDAFATTLPVALPTTKEVTATFASTDGAAQEALRLPTDRVPGLGGLRVTLASTALAGLDGAARYLFEYPYGCLEQTTSRVRPLLVGGALLDAFDLAPLGGDRRQVVEGWLGSLDEYWSRRRLQPLGGRALHEPVPHGLRRARPRRSEGGGLCHPRRSHARCRRRARTERAESERPARDVRRGGVG